MESKQRKPRLSTRALPIEPVLLRRDQAAAALSMSVDHFDDNVRPELKSVKVGSRTWFAPDDLRRWANEHKQPAPIDQM